MAIYEADLLGQGPDHRWDVEPHRIYVPPKSGDDLNPVDSKIKEGVRLYNQPDEDLLERVDERVGQAFKSMHHDPTHEYGACLAYGIEIDEESQELVDARIFGGIESHKGEIERRYTNENNVQFWLGNVGLRGFILSKNNVVLLDNGLAPDSVVYSLLSRSRP